MTYYHCQWAEYLVKLWQYLQLPHFLFVCGYIIEQRMIECNKFNRK